MDKPGRGRAAPESGEVDSILAGASQTVELFKDISAAKS